MVQGGADPRTPVTILSGWLGAGKTTLLNRVLADPQGRRFAVLINELGEIGIDHRLVVKADQDLIELSNGCVCCTVRGDLVRALVRLHSRRRRLLLRRRRFDHVLLESTGIAEPAPLLRTFLMEATVSALYRVASVVTLVDAHNAERALAERAALEQAALADLLLLSKLDLIAEGVRSALEARLARINPVAPQLPSTHGEADLAAVLADRSRHVGSARLAQGDRRGPTREGSMHEAIGAIALREPRPLDELQVQLWLRSCARLLEGRLLRYKGYLYLAGHEERVILQGVYELFSAEAGPPWGNESPVTEIVFIGRGLDAALLRRGLDACVA